MPHPVPNARTISSKNLKLKLILRCLIFILDLILFWRKLERNKNKGGKKEKKGTYPIIKGLNKSSQ